MKWCNKESETGFEGCLWIHFGIIFETQNSCYWSLTVLLCFADQKTKHQQTLARINTTNSQSQNCIKTRRHSWHCWHSTFGSVPSPTLGTQEMIQYGFFGALNSVFQPPTHTYSSHTFCFGQAATSSHKGSHFWAPQKVLTGIFLNTTSVGLLPQSNKVVAGPHIFLITKLAYLHWPLVWNGRAVDFCVISKLISSCHK